MMIIVSCILLLIILVVFLYFLYLRLKIPIDIVITWVDLDESLNNELKKNYPSYIKANYINNDEIIYCLRSIEKYAPWYNHIYLVIKDNTSPKWLKKNHSKITIINHSQIIPNDYLPIYNSLSIESFLHKIPNLSEYYIYFNDDMILLKPLSSFYFFDFFKKTIETNCQIISDSSTLSISIKDNYINASLDNYDFKTMIQFNKIILSHYFNFKIYHQSQHLPSANRITYQNSLDEFLDSIYLNNENINNQTKKSKERKNYNIARYSLFKKYWNIKKYKSSSKSYNIEYIEIDHLKSKKESIENLINSNKTFLCVQNNIAYGDINDQIGKNDFDLLRKILNEKFPEPSNFEIF